MDSGLGDLLYALYMTPFQVHFCDSISSFCATVKCGIVGPVITRYMWDGGTACTLGISRDKNVSDKRKKNKILICHSSNI